MWLKYLCHGPPEKQRDAALQRDAPFPLTGQHEHEMIVGHSQPAS